MNILFPAPAIFRAPISNATQFSAFCRFAREYEDLRQRIPDAANSLS
jgi:hypothetical protein